MPGDKVEIQAYARYSTPSDNATNYNYFVPALLAAFNLAVPVAGEVGTASAAIGEFGAWEVGVDGNNKEDDPIKAFVSIILFDKDYNFLDVAYEASGASGALISKSYTVTEPGYAYLYVSNEHPTQLNMYFDDVMIRHTPSLVIQSNDYYPFGLTFNSYQKESGTDQNYQYNGKELQDELDLGWLDYGARMYDATLGRWTKIDRLSEKFAPLSPYSYAACNPIIYIDINGDDIYYFDEKGKYTGYMVKDDGPNRGVYGGEEFVFGDQEHDHLNLVVHNEKDERNYDENTWFRVEVENGLDIDRRIEEAGAYDVNNKWDGLKKILEKKGEGRQDMGVGMQADPAKFGTHTIISTAKGRVSFSSRNYGNFLLAVAFAVMTDGMIDAEDTKALADLYEQWNSGEKDSRDDQKAIELGGEYYKDHYSDDSGKNSTRSSDKNYSQDFLKWYYDEEDKD